MENITLSEFNFEECARYLGYADNVPTQKIIDIMRECEASVIETAHPRFVYKVFDLEQEENQVGLAGSDLLLQGNAIAEHLKGCERAILMAATLSDSIDKLIKRIQLTDMATAVVLDAMASVAVEQLCEKAECMIMDSCRREYGQVYVTSRFGFGYGDLPLKQEKQALEILEADKRIGLYISESLLMVPKKSVCCIIGMSKQEINKEKTGCISCNMREKCQYRKRGLRCEK